MNRKTTLVLRMVPVGLLASSIMVAGCVAPAVGGAGAPVFNRGTVSADRVYPLSSAAPGTLSRHPRHRYAGAPNSSFPKTAIPR